MCNQLIQLVKVTTFCQTKSYHSVIHNCLIKTYITRIYFDSVFQINLILADKITLVATFCKMRREHFVIQN